MGEIWGDWGRLGGSGVVYGPMFSLSQCVPSPSGWPGNGVSLAYLMTDYNWFSRMCSPRCPGFSASGSAQRPIPQLQGKAEIGRLLSQGLWAHRQKLEQQLNEMRSFNASVPPPLGKLWRLG